MENQITLQELNLYIKEALELSFPDQIWIVAEIGELKVNRNGHCYIELIEKDEQSDQILARARATIWSWQFRFIKPYFETSTNQSLQAGIKVLLAATIEFHELYGLSLNIKDIDPTYTLGDLARKREEIIRQLKEDGVFDMNKELDLPDIPSRIAIISSPTAAGYQDFMQQLHENEHGYVFYTRLFESSMQGDQAAASIIHSLEHIAQFEDFFDAVVIIRGGGAQADLLCFDNYELALNIAQFPLPVLTGIGHEKDESIADMVSHTQLKTPTAVAEFLISRFDAVDEYLAVLTQRMTNMVKQKIHVEELRLSESYRVIRPVVNGKLNQANMGLVQLARDLKPMSRNVIEKQVYLIEDIRRRLLSESKEFIKQRKNKLLQIINNSAFIQKQVVQKNETQLSNFGRQLQSASKNRLQEAQKRLDWLEKNKELVDPDKILKRGFSIVKNEGKVIKSARQLSEGDELETIFYEGTIRSSVTKSEKNDNKKAKL